MAANQVRLTLDAPSSAMITTTGPSDSPAEHLASELLQLTWTSCLVCYRRSLQQSRKIAEAHSCRARSVFRLEHSLLPTPLVYRITLLYPRVTLLLTSIIRGMNPGAYFASMTLRRNTQVQLHRDAGNEPGLDNTIIPCSRWVGGCLWLQSEGGAHALDHFSGPGTMVRIGLPFAQFPPHLYHATAPWSGGDRTILIGFTPRRMERLTNSDRRQLANLGFGYETDTDTMADVRMLTLRNCLNALVYAPRH